MKSLAEGTFGLIGIFYKACWLGMEIQIKFRQEIKYSFLSEAIRPGNS